MQPYINTKPFEHSADDPETQAKLELARAAYTNAINDILERICDEFDAPEVKQLVAQDFALFTVYLVSLKMVLIAEEPAWRKRLLSAHQHLSKRIDREVPEMLIELARSLNGGRANEDGGTMQ